MKKILALIFVALLAFAVVGCTTTDAPTLPDNGADNGVDNGVDDDNDLPVFTLEELKQYDGREGRPAYVAVDGYVYDVTDVAAWSGGMHQGNRAGEDHSATISGAPHGRTPLNNLEKVGRLGD